MKRELCVLTAAAFVVSMLGAGEAVSANAAAGAALGAPARSDVQAVRDDEAGVAAANYGGEAAGAVDDDDAIASAGMRVYIDPVTGRHVEEPVDAAGAKAARARAVVRPDYGRMRTEVRPDGGLWLHTNGQVRMATVATMAADGSVQFDCAQTAEDDHAWHAHAALPATKSDVASGGAAIDSATSSDDSAPRTDAEVR